MQIKTPDLIRMSPRQFLRIGKVQKEQEEPLTEAQVKHRDRSYIISKLNKSIQQMQGDEKKKKVARDDYLNLYKETANQTKKEIPEEFTEKADKETLKKNKKQRNARFNKQPKVEEI